MNLFAANLGASSRKAVRRRLTQFVMPGLALASLLFATTGAHAACGSPIGFAAGAKLPMLAQAEGLGEEPSYVTANSIVGLWHVVYKTGDTLFNETLDQWHSDGTEFENAFLPPAAGNICFGVWKAVGPRSVRLHHIGWTYDPTMPATTANGTFTLDETNTVGRDGKTYSGIFTFTTYSLDGTPGPQIKGTMEATRITVQ